jgi:NAD(P)-dependent dehydrogenase (short-subunit alcohol dehydrogenase family)
MKSSLLVLGATGCIGRGVVEAALADGRGVIAMARDGGRLDALRKRHADADLTILRGSVASESEAAALVGALYALRRPLSGVVASLGGPVTRGRVLDRPVDALRRDLDEDLAPHLIAARHLLPLLAEANRGASYVLIGGPGGRHPWAGYGYRSVCTAALGMLARVLHDEARVLPVRVQLLSVDSPVSSEDNRAHAVARWPHPLDIGRRALALVDRASGTEPIVRFMADASAPSREPDPDDAIPQQVPERAPDLLPARCQQDAGKLLRSLLAIPARTPKAPAPNPVSPNPSQESPPS